MRAGFAAALVGLLSIVATGAHAQSVTAAPDQWERDIAAFEAADRQSPPPQGEIVFVGSSTIRLWNTAASFPDLKIINRGFGGSSLADTVRHAERIVIPYAPRLVVVYAGDNDISGGVLAEQVAFEFERLVKLIHAKLPQTRILYLAIKPSVLRWISDTRMDMANDMIRSICEKDSRLAILDIGDVMLGWDERPRSELFVSDGLHLSEEGYRMWTMLLRPFLLPAKPGS
jgi:lysophospholipase L1-like esterase